MKRKKTVHFEPECQMEDILNEFSEDGVVLKISYSALLSLMAATIKGVQNQTLEADDLDDLPDPERAAREIIDTYVDAALVNGRCEPRDRSSVN